MDMDMSSTNTTCNMSMLWNWDTIDTCFLAESWHVASNGAFAATCIGTILLVIVMEALRRLGKEYDDWIMRGFNARAATLEPPAPSCQQGSKNGSAAPPAVSKSGATTTVSSTATTAALPAAGQHNFRAVVFRASPLQQAVRSLLHAASLGVAYIVMLLVMSYNGYVIICVIIGGAIGKFFCDWMSKRVVVRVAGDIGGEEEKAAGLEEPSMCCG